MTIVKRYMEQKPKEDLSVEDGTFCDLVRKQIPWMSDGEAQDLLMCRTSFPFGGLDRLRTDILHAAAEIRRGFLYCGMCSNRVMPGGLSKWDCDECVKALHKHSALRSA